MIAVHMGHDNPAHVIRIEADLAELHAGFLVSCDPATFAGLHERMPPGLITWIVGMRAFTSVDQQKAFRMFHKPAVDGQPLGPLAVAQEIQRSERTRLKTRPPMISLDLHPAGLDTLNPRVVPWLLIRAGCS